MDDHDVGQERRGAYRHADRRQGDPGRRGFGADLLVQEVQDAAVFPLGEGAAGRERRGEQQQTEDQRARAA
jgi:hypothetical protein